MVLLQLLNLAYTKNKKVNHGMDEYTYKIIFNCIVNKTESTEQFLKSLKYICLS